MKKTKKVIALGLTAVMALSLSACGGRNAGNQPAATQAPAAEGGEAADSQGGQTAAAVTIKIGHVEAEDRSTHKALVEYFQKPVEEKSGGTIKVDISEQRPRRRCGAYGISCNGFPYGGSSFHVRISGIFS